MLVTDSWEIDSTLRDLGLGVYVGELGALDVEAEDGDYVRVLGYESSVVYIHSIPNDLLQESLELREHRRLCKEEKCENCTFYFPKD